jgi:hypothetical protein
VRPLSILTGVAPSRYTREEAVKEAKFTDTFKQTIIESGEEGISAGELHEQVGSSRQAVYQFIKANQRNLVETGARSPSNGVRYKWVDRQTSTRGNADGVEVGSTFTVTRMRLSNGKVIVTLAGPGIELDATLN